jgi:hypothetical protein
MFATERMMKLTFFKSFFIKADFNSFITAFEMTSNEKRKIKQSSLYQEVFIILSF